MDSAGKDFPRTMAELCANVSIPKRPIAQLSLGGLLDFEVTKNIDKKKDNIVVPNNHFICEMAMKIHELVDEVNELRAELEKPKEVIGLKEQTEDETIDSVLSWHRKTFPNATANGQLNKWDEEYAEFRDACRHGTILEQIRELVDLFVVACGIMRFNTEAGCMKMLHWCELRKEHAYFFPTVLEELNKKMKKNRARKWEYLGNGNYHHVKGVED
jgi:hypothetical protein